TEWSNGTKVSQKTTDSLRNKCLHCFGSYLLISQGRLIDPIPSQAVPFPLQPCRLAASATIRSWRRLPVVPRPVRHRGVSSHGALERLPAASLISNRPFAPPARPSRRARAAVPNRPLRAAFLQF